MPEAPHRESVVTNHAGVLAEHPRCRRTRSGGNDGGSTKPFVEPGYPAAERGEVVPGGVKQLGRSESRFAQEGGIWLSRLNRVTSSGTSSAGLSTSATKRWNSEADS